MIDNVLVHVDKTNTTGFKHFVKILYVDFSSAFNTIQPHIMMQKLCMMNVNSRLILWIKDFLTERPQYVKFSGHASDCRYTYTGAPQGCVLSPLLFTLYTSDCRSQSKQCKIYKYADDTAIVSQCINDDYCYQTKVANFVQWCKDNFLELNVKKTKEMVIDYRSSDVTHTKLYIENKLVESVEEYKYLGVTIDVNFNFHKHCDALYKKLLSRMYFVRKLHRIGLECTIMDLFYSSILQSVIIFAITCWYGNCTKDAKSKIIRIINNCRKLGVNTVDILDIYKKCTMKRFKSIRSDPSHPLYDHYQMLPSGRRFRSIKCRTERYSRSYVPSSIRILNDLKMTL